MNDSVAPPKMQCPYCGKEINQNSFACQYCGRAVLKVSSSHQKERRLQEQQALHQITVDTKEKPMLSDTNSKGSNLLSKSFKLTTHLLSIFIPSIIISVLLILFIHTNSSSASFLDLVGRFLLMTLGYSIYTFLYYCLAGGMEWNAEEMSYFRKWIFFSLSLFLLGLFYVAIWHSIRSFMAKRYQIPKTIAMGHLH